MKCVLDTVIEVAKTTPIRVLEEGLVHVEQENGEPNEETEKKKSRCCD